MKRAKLIVVFSFAFLTTFAQQPSGGNSAFSKNDAQRLQDAKQIPDGCDPAFSLITTPRLSNVYGRCTT